jgi:hypothetical protein
MSRQDGYAKTKRLDLFGRTVVSIGYLCVICFSALLYCLSTMDGAKEATFDFIENHIEEPTI